LTSVEAAPPIDLVLHSYKKNLINKKLRGKNKQKMNH